MVMTATEPAPGAPNNFGETTLSIPPLVRLKVAPPPTDPHTLQRPRLLRALDEATASRLTLLAAPAGYGKTSLLSTWAARVSTRQPGLPRLAWISLSGEANAPLIYLTMLAAALQGAGVPLTWPPYPLLTAGQELRMTLIWALNAVAELNEPIVLVLDGYEALVTAEAHELTSLVLDHAPPLMRVVVASRGEPPLPLARLRAHRQLAELRADTLRWNVAEAGLYLNDRLGLGLDPAQIAGLVESTEGWVTGLNLAALILEGGRAASADVVAHRFVADYLVGEVLEREPEVIQSFILQSAILDALSGPLVEALLLPEAGSAERAAVLGGFPSGQAALEALERRGVFLHSLEGRPGWYRYQRLFAATMRAQLLQRFPERAAELYERAARLSGGQAPGVPSVTRDLHGRESLAEPLSEREQEILDLIAAGKPNREIADLLSISESTVKSHLKHIFAKLSARNRTEAVAIARDLQLLSR